MRSTIVKRIILMFVGLGIYYGAYAQNSFRLYIAMNDLNSNTWRHLKDIDVSEAKVVFGQYIYRKNGFDLMDDALIREIKRLFPEKNSIGIGILDWEGPAYEALKNKKGNLKMFNKAKEGFINAIILAKKIRPNVKWGYFGLPFKRVFGNKLFSKKELNLYNESILPILKNCDILFPSCYDSYLSTFSQNVNYIQQDLLRALKIGFSINKPVMPLVWHRYSNPKSNKMFGLMPESKFLNLVKSLNNVIYKKNRISGIIWWGGDTRFYKRGDGNIKSEAKNLKLFEEKYNSMVQKYSNDIKGK